MVIDHLVVKVVIKHVSGIGHLLLPYFCAQHNPSFLTVVELLSAEQLDTENSNTWLIELHQLSQSIDPDELVKRFSKKKLTAKAFFKDSDKKIIENLIQPFIWKQMERIIQLCKEQDIEIYSSKSWPNLYPENRIAIGRKRAEAMLYFKKLDEGTNYVFEAHYNNQVIDLQQSENILLTQTPCYFVADGVLMRFDDSINGKLLLPFLKSSTLHIPQRIEKEYYSKFIKKIVNHVEIEAEGFQIIDLEVQPKAQLTLESDWQQRFGMVLRFDYGERKLLANQAQQSFTTLITDQSGFLFKRFKRALIQEAEAVEHLIQLGFKQDGAFFYFDTDSKEEAQYIFLSKLAEFQDRLQELGMEVLQKSDHEYVLDRPIIKIQEQIEKDWFDLQLIIEIGERRIPFMSLRNHLLNGIRVFKLDSGELFVIPNEWFERYRSILIHAQPRPAGLRMKKFHANLLNAFDYKKTFETFTEIVLPTEPILPALKDVQMRNYQVYGFFWLRNLMHQGLGAVLADDMGLGKTLQVIALLADYFTGQKQVPQTKQVIVPSLNLKMEGQLDLFEDIPAPTEMIQQQQHESASSPALIVMPTSLIHNWRNELNRFAPFLRVADYTGIGRKISQKLFKNKDVILTTYGTLRNDIDFLKGLPFSFVVLDESQNIKNAASKTAKAAFELNASFRIALTGTPIENHLSDIWSQMNFVNQGLLGELNEFNKYYALPVAKDVEAIEGKKLRDLIQPFILRRTKSQVAPELPKLSETTLLCDMTQAQQALYEAEKSRLRNYILEVYENEGDRSKISMLMLGALMKLRQLANHPKMVDVETEAESGKYEVVTETLETLVAEGHKVLVFSSFVSHLNLIEDWCKENEFPYAMLTGGTRGREQVINKFKMKKAVQLFLISLKAGGVGLNLVEADYVFMLDPWWNPAAEMQAISRAHRIGQKKNVFVYRFISKDTVEEKILQLQAYKQQLAETFVVEEQIVAGMNKEQMLALLS